jgi:lipid-binding SYLF domain-containing protein
MKTLLVTTVVTTLAFAPLMAADEASTARLKQVASVFSEIMNTPDQGIPRDLLEKANCIVIVPETRALYGAAMEGRAVMTGNIAAPKEAAALMVLLSQYSANEKN